MVRKRSCVLPALAAIFLVVPTLGGCEGEHTAAVPSGAVSPEPAAAEPTGTESALT